MDLVRLAFALLCLVLAAPPTLGIVIPFSVNVLVTSFLIVYIGCHMSMDPSLNGNDEVTASNSPQFSPFVCLGNRHLIRPFYECVAGP